jgi:hypothetical protein
MEDLPMARSIHSAIVTVLLASLGCRYEMSLPHASRTYDGPSGALKKTVIVPTLDTPFVEGKSAIWCGSFQMAWNQFKKDLTRGPIQLAGASQEVKRLNNAPQSASDLPDGSWYAAAGRGEDHIIERIQHDMAVRFPSVPTPQFPFRGPYAIAYAYLQAGMKFGVPFLQNPDKLDFHASDGEATAVASFGLPPGVTQKPPDPMVDQVVLIFHSKTSRQGGAVSPTEFAINLSRSSTPFHAIVACIPRQPTLLEAIEYVERQATTAGPGQMIHHDDRLLVPEMCWRLQHDFVELMNLPMRNKGFEGYSVDSASQMIDFKIDRYGVELKSEGRFGASRGMITPRAFVLDRPFLLYLKMPDAKWPFFVMWVDNAELLRKF